MYREDEVAARARADALQVDLDRTQAELEATKLKLAAAEAKLGMKPSMIPLPPRSPDERRERVFTAFFVAFVGALILWGAL